MMRSSACSALVVAVTWLLQWIAVSSLTEEANSLTNALDKQRFKYPKEWVQRCGDDEGNITIFYEGIAEFERCYQQLIDVNSFRDELFEALQEEKMGTFMKKECTKVIPLKKCITDMVQSVEHCFNDSEKEDVWTVSKMIHALFDFICHRDGERVLMFLKDDGMDCVTTEQENLERCTTKFKEDGLNNVTVDEELSFLERLQFDEPTCIKLFNMSDCLFATLKKCSDRTPSLLLEGLSKTILKTTPCWNYVSSSVGTSVMRLLDVTLVILVALFYQSAY